MELPVLDGDVILQGVLGLVRALAVGAGDGVLRLVDDLHVVRHLFRVGAEEEAGVAGEAAPRVGVRLRQHLEHGGHRRPDGGR